MLGDTAVAVHPEDERYAKLVGRNVRLPLVGRLIPIVADEYSDPEKGTGAVKITPAHDFNDFEVGKRHGLRLVNVLDAEARVTLRGNEEFFEGFAASGELDATVEALDGLDRFKARARVVAMMDERGLLAEIADNIHSVPHGDRSHAVLEPRLTDQWYVDAKTLAQPALAAVRDGRTNFVPKNWEKTYFEWLENIQPWCISRQLWWGHRIPAWYDEDGNVFVAESEQQALEAAREKHKRDVTLTRDEDVLDTWFSSALWPFSTLGWPDETPELERYYPTSVLVTGFDIIFFWVARMMMMGLHFQARSPLPRRLHPRPRPRREGLEDVEVEGQCHRSPASHHGLWRRRLALHARGDGRAGPRHKARDQPRRRLSQFRDEAVERLALRRDQRLRARERL